MASAISQSSAATVIEDLVSDRSIPLKVCMIILNVAQLISCWIAVGYFIKTYESWSTLELTLSLALIFAGNYLIPSLANAIIYGRRWKRSSVSHRRQMEEENKQAWVCLRIALSLIGVPTVGRYIETIIVSRKLSVLEKKHVKESVVSCKEGSQLNPTSTSRIGSTPNQLKSGYISRTNSVISGISQTSSLPEISQRKVRKARRQYKRCEHDGALMALIAGSVGAGPFAIGIGFLYFQHDEKRAMKSDQVAALCASFVLNLLWLSATLTHFYPARHVLSQAEFERGIRPSHMWALILLYASHLVQITLRVLCFVIFVSWYYAYVCIPIIFHWLLGTFLLVVYQAYMKPKTVGRPIAERIRRETGWFFASLFFGYVGIFDFINGNQGKTRLRYLIYYTFYYIENVAMLVIWILRNPITQIRFPIPFVCCVLGLFWLGFILLQLYLYYFSYSPYGTSVIGLCVQKQHYRQNCAEVAREPVFGVAISQSAVPFWKQNQHSNRNTASRISGQSSSRNTTISDLKRPISLNHSRSMSILSSQSHNQAPSIFSQSSSQLNFGAEKPKPNPNIKSPPVIKLKERNESLKQSLILDSSSESSLSDDDGLEVFSPKAVPARHSNPDLMFQFSESNSSSAIAPRSSIITGPLQGQLKIEPLVRNEPPKSNPRSLERTKAILPIAPPNITTKRIGTGPMPIKGALRPLPSKEQIRKLQNSRGSLSREARVSSHKY